MKSKFYKEIYENNCWWIWQFKDGQARIIASHNGPITDDEWTIMDANDYAKSMKLDNMERGHTLVKIELDEIFTELL